MALGWQCRRCGGTERYAANGRCSACQRKRAKEQYYADPEGRKAKARNWKLKNPEQSLAASRKAGRMDWLPGEHERAEIARAAATKCEVCSSPDPRHKRGWNADHDHATGRFRGIICHPCNIAIAHVEKFDLDRGAQIGYYLAEHR